jgi:Asp/Glu/hydantoin racemase
MTRIVWQGFVSPVEQKIYVDTLVEYLNAIADPEVEFSFEGIDVPDRHLHRLTELRCAHDVLRNVVDAGERGYDGVIMGHFQDAGLYEARAALSVPVVGLGESALLHACTLGRRIGLVTIDPAFVPWHEEQVERYKLEGRVVGVTAMRTPVDLYMRALEDPGAHDEVVGQFEREARPLLERGAEVIVPAGGLPALILRERAGYEIDGAVVLNPTAVAAKAAEMAVKLARLNGTGASRRSTFAPPPPEAIAELRGTPAR